MTVDILINFLPHDKHNLCMQQLGMCLTPVTHIFPIENQGVSTIITFHALMTFTTIQFPTQCTPISSCGNVFTILLLKTFHNMITPNQMTSLMNL
jgi:hypothetical protein